MTRLPALPRLTDPRPDAELLDRFASHGDEVAFAELVRRYGGLVWAVCRRLTPDRHAAEDAFQATFLVLVRRAGAVRRATAASFLHGVARRVAARCRRRAGQPLAEMATADADPLTTAIQREEAETLHAELARLPAGCREVLLLCDLGGLSRVDAADRLGWSEGSVKGRLERGRKLLAARLAKRGVAGGLVVATAVPAELAAGVCRSAVAVWLGGPLPAGLAGLVRVGLPWGVGKLAATSLLGIGLATTLAAFAGPTDPPPAPPATKPMVAKLAADHTAVLAALREAEAAVEKATGDDMARNRLLCDLAELYRRAGDPKGSAAALGKAKTVTDGMDDFRFHEWRRIAQGYARLGDSGSGLALAEVVPEGRHRATRETILQEAATAATQTDRPAVAAKLIAALTGAETRDWLTAESRVAAVVRSARTDGPAAINAVLALPDPAERVQALVGTEFLNLFPVDLADSAIWLAQYGGVADRRRAAGDRAGAAEAVNAAVALLPAIKPRGQLDRRPRLTAAVAGSAARLDDLATCRTLDDNMPADKPVEKFKNGWKPKVTAYRAAAEAVAGNDAAAVKLADGFPTVEEQTHVLLAVAAGQHKAGRKDAATATFDRVFTLQKAQVYPSYHDLMHTRGRVGDLAGLKTVLAAELDRDARQNNGTPDRPPTAEQLAWAAAQSSQPEYVAHWQAEHGDFAGALETAKAYQLGEPTLHVRTRPGMASILKAVADRQTAAGKAADVRKDAAAETDLLFRAHRFAGLATGLLGRDW